MNINKDYLIYGLSLVVSILIGYIIMQEPHIEIVTKTKIKTIVKEKIVYRNNEECIEKKKIAVPLKNTVVTTEKENIISLSVDNRNRFNISLVTNEKLDDTEEFQNVILNGTIKKGDYQSIFIMDVNQVSLKQNDIFFKIKDNHLKKISLGNASCLQDVLENFIYKVELEIIDNDINCIVFQDREIKENSEPLIIKHKTTTPMLPLPKDKEDLGKENTEKRFIFQKEIERILKKDSI